MSKERFFTKNPHSCPISLLKKLDESEKFQKIIFRMTGVPLEFSRENLDDIWKSFTVDMQRQVYEFAEKEFDNNNSTSLKK